MSAIPATRWSKLLEYAEARLPALTRLKRAESLPIHLDRHRIYVLPTRFGLLYTAVLIVVQAFRLLNRLDLHALRSEPCHAGDPLRVSLHFRIHARRRQSLRLQAEGQETVFDLAGDGAITIEFSAPRRGWRKLERMRLSSEYPFGLFHVWSWLNPEFAALIYPRAETNPPPLPRAGAATASRTVRMSGDELASLREYRPEDPQRNIAWKASARHDELLVKEFELRRGQEIVLDYSALHGLAHEARISRLARWVSDAETAQQPYALQLPERRLGPALGTEHRHACLRELALLP